eukprot:GGOE01042697.1.p1 GENE.GGOE01042697.1~~GGOE01042697.1.p1  ORF type:complete len:219 (+),score=75.77 GGOE01042697.1:30-659(+)
MSTADLYAILGVSRTTSAEQITAAYRRKALEWHPDRNPHRRTQAEAKFKEVSNAYSVLSDANRRADYDRQQRAGAGSSGAGFDFNFGPGGGMPPGWDSPEEVFRNVFGQAECPAPPLFWWPLMQLLAALAIDFVGLFSMILPGIGEMADTLWAPVSAYLIKNLFDDSLFATLGLLEELLPLTDFIPTASLCWARQYWRFIPQWLGLASL